MAIEPLIIALRRHSGILGIRIGESDHRIALFADDIILFLWENLEISIPSLLNLIKIFSKLSGDKINNSNSSIMLLNPRERSDPPTHVRP